MNAEELRWRSGFELELLAPRGSDRRALAEELAARHSGTVRTVWHEDSEPADIPSLGGRFLHLTQGFETSFADGTPLCTVVDDITIRSELDQAAPARPGWLRVLTDDPRLLHLLARHCEPASSLETVLDPVAALFGDTAERIGNIWRLDTRGATVALASPAGGERERPCEIVTPPLATGHFAALEALLAPARELEFTVPVEAAVHIHYDGVAFRNPAALANLVRLFAFWREPLRAALETNAHCRRLAALPDQLVQAVAGTPSMDELRAAASEGGLTKFFDINLTNVLRDDPLRDTVEVRILPGSLDAADVIRRAGIVERLLDRCLDPTPIRPPESDETIASILV
jgi:Putative amidoligase enzyme